MLPSRAVTMRVGPPGPGEPTELIGDDHWTAFT
jgi:hypothetical protein